MATLLVASLLLLAACGEDEDVPAPDPTPAAQEVATEAATAGLSEASLARLADLARAATRQQDRRAAQRQARREARREARERAEQRAERRARARARAAANPLAGRPWGVYQGPADQAWPPYDAATGETKRLLGRIALAPKAKWFGAWIPDDQIGARVTEYIDNAQAGDPEALVQMTVFRMVPWEHEACRRSPSTAEQASYKRWVDRFAAAVGDTPTAIILQPDGPFSLCAPGGPGLPASLVAYAARAFGALPESSVYIDAGAGDWPAAGQGGVAEVLRFLVPAGIESVRGIALNSTHYSSTEAEVQRGAAIVEALADRGIGGKHVVVNTSSNGNPFPFGTYTGPDPDDAFVCASPDDERTCVTLGIRPTTEVADPAWGLSESARAAAREHVDAYLWFGRPWLYRQNDPFVMQRALDLVRSTPY